MGDYSRTKSIRFLLWVAAFFMVTCLVACGAAGSGSGTATGTGGGAQESAHSAASASTAETKLAGWKDDSAALTALKEFVSASVDQKSASYIPPEDRIAVFDMDGTLLGERFPTYFNDWLYIQRALYDNTYEAPAELKEFAQRWEDKVLRGAEFPDFDEKERELGPKLYEGLTVEQYQDVVRKFKAMPVWGFEGMTYGEGFFKPMLSVVEYLHNNGYTVYVNSGTYRDAVRVMMEGTFDQWIPASQVIGTDLLFKASDQGEKEGYDYTMQPSEDLKVAGELFVKNLKTNKVTAMEREIGKRPVLAFGNSSGDFAMANYALQNKDHPGKAFMLLCDNTEQDYGDTKVAKEFAEKCNAAGFTTISMANDWTTIYGDGVKKVEPKAEELPAAA